MAQKITRTETRARRTARTAQVFVRRTSSASFESYTAAHNVTVPATLTGKA